MKKGVFLMILSFVLGLTYLIFAYLENPIVVITKRFWFVSRSVNLPAFRLAPFLIIVTLAVLVNLFALISSSGAVAMGAGVLYAVAIGLEPDCYPYVFVQFLLCVIAAARACRSHEEIGEGAAAGADRERTAYQAKNTEAEKAMSAQKKAAEQAMAAQKKAAEKAMNSQSKLARVILNAPDSSTASGLESSSYEALRAQEERESFRTNNRSKIMGFVFFGILLLALSVLLPILLQYNKSRKNRTVTKETISLALSGSDRTGTGNQEDEKRDTDGTFAGGAKTEHADQASIDLEGDWVTDHTSGTGMAARVESDRITFYWMNTDGSFSLYWAGKFLSPIPSKEPFSCMVMMDIENNITSPFASRDASKTISYADGTLSIPVTTMGIPITFRLHRSSEKLKIE